MLVWKIRTPRGLKPQWVNIFLSQNFFANMQNAALYYLVNKNPYLFLWHCPFRGLCKSGNGCWLPGVANLGRLTQNSRMGCPGEIDSAQYDTPWRLTQHSLIPREILQIIWLHDSAQYDTGTPESTSLEFLKPLTLGALRVHRSLNYS